MNATEVLSKLFKAFPTQPGPLQPGDQRYVEKLHTEGETEKRDPVRSFARSLALSSAPSVSLFSGLIGSGKSTELLRLQKILLEEYQVRAFMLDMAEYVNLNQAIQITDLLVSIVAALSDKVEAETGKNPITANSKLEEFFSFLSAKVELKEFEVDTKIGLKVKGSLKRDQGFKERIQETLNSDRDRFFKAGIHALEELSNALRNRYNNDDSFVLILDSLEQLQDPDIRSNNVKSSLVQLYSQFLDQLHITGFKTVYSVPPYLPTLVPQLSQHLGAICRLTNVHVFKDRTKSLDDQGGVLQLRLLVERRTKDFATVNELFSPKAFEAVVKSSGGDLRTFFTLIRQSALYELESERPSLPIAEKTVLAAVKQIRNSLGLVPGDVLKRLAAISSTHQPDLSSNDALNALMQDLDTKRVMLYRNGNDWYGVSPLLWPDLESQSVTIKA